MALFWRIFGTLVAVTALSLVVFVGLATVQYDAVLAGLMRDRISVIVQNIAEPLRAVVDLGLPINRKRDAAALLERTRQSETEIVGIHLFDNQGNIVLSTAGVLLLRCQALRWRRSRWLMAEFSTSMTPMPSSSCRRSRPRMVRRVAAC